MLRERARCHPKSAQKRPREAEEECEGAGTAADRRRRIQRCRLEGGERKP